MTPNSVLQSYISVGEDCTLEGACIDWLTLTGEHHPACDGVQGCDIWDAVHMTSEEWAGNGYAGLYCRETKLRYGIRSDTGGKTEEIVISSGKTSQDVAAFMVGEQTSLSATRTDYQSTVMLDRRDAEVAHNAYTVLSALLARGKKPTGSRAFNCIRGVGGDTLYIGNRGSKTKFFRLYDKGGQRGNETGLEWRQEVQFNRKFAQSAFRQYLLVMHDPVTISNVVSRLFSEECGFSLIPEFSGGVRVNIVPSGERETDYEAKLKWLRACVRPVVLKLSEIGLEAEVRRTLGLPRDWRDEANE